MKKGVHPEYGPVAFRDSATGDVVVTRSTLVSRLTEAPTIEIDDQACPVVDVDITAHSHPFWTGRRRTIDQEGRVERFLRRYGNATGEQP